MTGFLKHPQHGELRDGYFYELYLEHLDLAGFNDTSGILDCPLRHPVNSLDLCQEAFRVTPSWLSDDEEEAWYSDPENLVPWTSDAVVRLTCRENEEHNDRWFRRKKHHIRIVDQRPKEMRRSDKTPFVMMQLESIGGGGPKFISQRLAERISRCGITGARFFPVEISEIGEFDRFGVAEPTKTPTFDPKLMEWMFIGTPCDRGYQVFDAPDACPFCGHEPLICKACGETNYPCKKCGEGCFSKDETGKHRMDVKSDGPLILEGKNWDGSDLICGRTRTCGFVTHRVVEWLVAVHAAPFYAAPVRVCVDGMTPEQVLLLETAKDVRSLMM